MFFKLISRSKHIIVKIFKLAAIELDRHVAAKNQRATFRLVATTITPPPPPGNKLTENNDRVNLTRSEYLYRQ